MRGQLLGMVWRLETLQKLVRSPSLLTDLVI